MNTAGRTPSPNRAGLATRRRIARFCDGVARTTGEIAAHLGREDGGARSILSAMRSAGHLESVEREGTRAQALILTDEGRSFLLGSQLDGPPGMLERGLRIVIVGERAGALPAEVFRQLESAPGFRWGALLYGGGRFLAAFDDDRDVERFRRAAQRHGVDTAIGAVAGLLDRSSIASFFDDDPAPRAIESA